ASFFTSSGAFAESDEPLIRSGESIAFMGDSITQQGASRSSGYVQLVGSGLAVNGIDVTLIPAGISGHKSNQMLSRLKGHVLDKNPDWMTLSCGVNDVWHRDRGVSLEDYKVNITEIVDQCEEAGVKVMILTSTPIKETDNELNQKLALYNDFLRELAEDRGLVLVDLNADFWEELNQPTQPRPHGNYLTSDGVHMNPNGNILMATGILEGFGLSEEQVAKAQEEWNSKLTRVQAGCDVSVAKYKEISRLAAEQGISVNHLLAKVLSKGIDELVE
ncbi:MAG: SGNH/GDSL hydrolase family protein, partial [Puniceicoccales bacterium]